MGYTKFLHDDDNDDDDIDSDHFFSKQTSLRLFYLDKMSHTFL